MKRFLYITICTLLSIGAWAQNVAKIGTTEYATLADAVAAVQNGETIVLLEDITLTATTTIGASADRHARKFTIDFDGHTVTKSSSTIFTIYDDVTLTGNGQIDYYGYGISSFAIKAFGDVTIDGVNITDKKNNAGGILYAASGATLTLKNGTVTSDKPRSLVQVANGGNFVMDGGKLISNYNTASSSAACINVATGGTATINAGELEGALMAAWVDGILDINGGKFTSQHVIWVNKGTANISGGEFYANPTAVYLYTATATANISGGEFWATGSDKKFLLNILDSVRDGASLTVTGGIFHDFNPWNNTAEGPGTCFVPDDYKSVDNGDGTYSVVEREYVAQIGEKKYESLTEAIEAAQNDDTVTLLADVNTEAQIEISGKEIILDLNGNTIAYTGTTTLSSGVLLVHNGAGLTVNATDGGAVNSGEKAYAAIAVTKAGDDASKPAKLIINGGNITGTYYGITGNGKRHNTEITINGGVITATANKDNLGIYHPQNGTLTITGGTITGYSSAIELRAGTLNISGGTFTSTATEFSCAPNNNGTTTVGAAIAIAQHTTKNDINVTISGGEFYGVKALNESNPQVNDPAPQVTMEVSNGTFHGAISTADVNNFISGGTFSEAVPEQYCAPGYSPVTTPNSDGMYEVETTKVASVGDNRYTSLQEAVNAANGETVTLLMDITLDNRIDVNGNMTINLDGKTITTTATCGNGSAFNVVSGNVTIKNGVIDAAFGEANSGETDAITARSGSNVTLEDLDITVKSKEGSCAYAFNEGHITIESGTYKNTTTEAYPYNPLFQALVVNQYNTATLLVTVKGGIFYGQDPSDGDDSGKVITFLPETRATVHNIDGDGAGYYEVVDAEASIGVKGYATLDTAIDIAKDVAEAVTVKLLADAETLNETLPANLTIDANNKVLTMPSFLVLDGEAITYPKVTGAETYKVHTATYIRTNVSSTVWGTVCLPFSLTSDNGADYYTYSNISGSTLTVDEATTIAPNTPVVFKKGTGDLNINETNATVSLNATPADSGALIGTYADTDIPADGTIYFINGDTFHKAQVSLKVPMYRAYIKYASTESKLYINVSGEENVDAIGTLTMDNAEVEAVYDAAGRRIQTPQQGLNIMRLANGKTVKVMVK